MITIYNDFQKTSQVECGPYVLIASQPQEYIPLRQWLRRALNDPDHNYTVYLQRSLLAKWLADLKDYPVTRMRWIDLSMRDRFQEQFGFPPPVELDDTALNDLAILALDPPSTSESADPTGWILGHKFGLVWKAGTPYQGHLSNLAAWAVHSQPARSSLAALARQRLTDWSVVDDRYRFFLNQSWPAAGEAILLRWALRNYPDNFGLRQQQQSAPLEDCQRQMTAISTTLEKYRTDLSSFWRGWLAQHQTQELVVAVKMMSGMAQVELDILTGWLQDNSAMLNNELLDIIRHHFAVLPNLETTITRLELLVAPSIPQTPQSDWPTEQWLTWATTEYLPYFAWVMRHRQPRKTQMVLAQQFADWLVSAYSSLMFSHNPVMVTAQQNHLRHLFAANQIDVVFWLIIDGLTWWQGRRLAELYTQTGLGVVDLGPHLSALPSVTVISKRAIAQGYLDQSADRLPIAKLLENRFADDILANVYTQVEAFEEAITEELRQKAYILLYNAVDRHNHDSRRFTADESVDGYLQLIVRLTNAAFQQCIRQGLRTRAIISSDHGSTLLPADTAVLDTPRFAQLVDDEESDETTPDQSLYQRTRACAIERKPAPDELSRLESDWYLLRSDVFNLPHHFLIPKGYAAVKRRPFGWTHGGATPEETVTPFFEIQPQPIEIASPLIKIEGVLRAAQPSQFQITVINPNPTPLNAVRFIIAGFPEPIEWPRIQPNTPYNEIITVPAATSKDDFQILEWTLTGEAGGRRQQFSGQVKISVRRFQRSAVDELFEGL